MSNSSLFFRGDYMEEKQPKRRLKVGVKIIISVAIFLLLLVFLIIFLFGPVNPTNKTKIDIEINNGTSTNQIAEILKDKKLIRSKALFKLYSKLFNTRSISIIKSFTSLVVNNCLIIIKSANKSFLP